MEGTDPEPFCYRGVLLGDLRIDEIDWEANGEHLQTRSQRRAGDMDLDPEWATAAALDPYRMLRARGNDALEVVGSSPSAPPVARILKVWIRPMYSIDDAKWEGGSACPAGPNVRRIYNRRRYA